MTCVHTCSAREKGISEAMSPKRRTDSSGERAVYMISVAAELSGMHPQTLRVY